MTCSNSRVYIPMNCVLYKHATTKVKGKTLIFVTYLDADNIYLKHVYQHFKNILLFNVLKRLWTYPYICDFTTRYAVLRYAVVVNTQVGENAHCWKLTAF